MGFSRRKPAYDEASLYEYAVGALARRMRSVAELKRLLRQRVAGQDDGPHLLEAVVERLKQQHYLNDTEYAIAYSGYRRENEKFGQRRVISDLKSRGIHPDVIEKTIEESYAGVDEEKLARQFLLRKRLRRPEDHKQAARVFRALLRAGYNTRTIGRILKKWDVEDDVISALEAEEGNAGEY